VAFPHPDQPEEASLLERPLEAVLKQDRAVILAGLAGITALAWAYMFYLAWAMRPMDMGAMQMAMDQAMPQMQAWGPVELLLTFVMWAVMMVAMMVPSAAPMILLFATINRKRRQQDRPHVATSVFLAAYLLVWTLFSALATLVQWGLHSAELLSPMMVSTNPILGGTLLIAAGVFQWTPLKHACLAHCRAPFDFLMTDWREGNHGAFLMGLKHGVYCLGCCWFLMGLLFVAGVMNLLWVAAIALFVLVEKVVPSGPVVSRVTGAVLMAAGIALLTQGF
jgi:predicted metal-binding membrane protein